MLFIVYQSPQCASKRKFGLGPSIEIGERQCQIHSYDLEAFCCVLASHAAILNYFSQLDDLIINAIEIMYVTITVSWDGQRRAFLFLPKAS